MSWHKANVGSPQSPYTLTDLPKVKTKPILAFILKRINLLVKLPLTLLLLWVLYRQVFAEGQGQILLREMGKRWQWPHLWLFFFVVGMMPLNLALETWKFRLLTKQFLPTGFPVLFKSVLGGMAVALVTPNRIGEYAGRVLFLKKKYGWQAVAATVVGSLSQLLIIIGAGLVGTLAYHSNWLTDNGVSVSLLLFFGVSLVGVMLVFYYNVDLLLPLLRRVPLGGLYRKILSRLSFLRHYSFGKLSAILLVAAVRYLTYCTQYVLLLWFFGLEAPFQGALATVAMVFLIQASIPLPPLASLIARGELALMAFGANGNELLVPVMSATFLLFFINVALPALAGLFLIWFTNIRETLGLRFRR